jgi:predicted nucleic acid-binding protein
VPARVCVDASLAVRWLLPEDYSDESLTLLNVWTESHTELIAPTHLLYEVSATLRFLVYRKAVSEEIGHGAFSRLQKLPIRFSSRTAIFPLAWQLATEFNLPSTYDVAYLALARLERCQLWTADRKFFKAVKNMAPEVKWIGNYR